MAFQANWKTTPAICGRFLAVTSTYVKRLYNVSKQIFIQPNTNVSETFFFYLGLAVSLPARCTYSNNGKKSKQLEIQNVLLSHQ